MSGRYQVGSCGVGARNHAICDGPHVVAMVSGAGYPAGKGWHPKTEALAAWIAEAMNEKAEREARHDAEDKLRDQIANGQDV